MQKNRNRRIERHINAKDLAERLLPDLNMNELLLWSPDLFAYTSYVMSQTGAYQIVVSPPMGKSWSPRNHEIKELIGKDSSQILRWLKSFLVENNENNVKDIIDGNNAEKWIFDPEKWTPNDKGFFDDNLIKRVKRKDATFAAKLQDIADQVHESAEKALLTPMLDREIQNLRRKYPHFKGDETKRAKEELEKIKFARPELKEFFFDEKSVSFEPENAENEKEAEIRKEYEKTITGSFNGAPKKLKDVSLDDLLEFDEEQNWVQFVQMVGDEWEHGINRITDTDFFIINDGERKTEPKADIGELFTDANGKVSQWNNKILKERYDVKDDDKKGYLNREKDALGVLLKYTPPLLLAVWAYFYNEATREDFYGDTDRSLRLVELLCNQDHLQNELPLDSQNSREIEESGDLLEDLQNLPNIEEENLPSSHDSRKLDRLWNIAVALLTMHAIADICCTSWGLKSVEKNGAELTEALESENAAGQPDKVEAQQPKSAENSERLTAQLWAERLLFSKGSLATINPERCRVVPKRHNPQVGITLRSLSSNLAFHRSSVEVAWRKTSNTELEKRLANGDETISILLIPYPFEVKAKDFEIDIKANDKVGLPVRYGFFGYKSPSQEAEEIDKENLAFLKLVKKAEEELGGKNPNVDVVVFPETALSKKQFEDLEKKFEAKESRGGKNPSLLVAGVRESREDIALEFNEKNKELNGDKKPTLPTNYTAEDINFSRNAVYCKYFDEDSESGFGKPFNGGQTPKYKQYKHHRWKLDASQIDRYGLSQILDDEMVWWESIKIPRRRVSFLNVGDKITVANLICEDLARQDPIADLIRHVGPSLVITLLMDGPQLRSRWSSRYASILADDPGSSVITLTSWGMVKRHSSNFGLMSRVVALWSESDSGILREIELAEGAQAILLNLRLKPKNEKTADGRQERFETTVLRLKDVIQIYPEKS